MRKIGEIKTWRVDKGWGVVQVGSASSLERYFLPIGQIRTCTGVVMPGLKVEFEVSPHPVAEGRFPIAVKADIIPYIEPSHSTLASAALAGPTAAEAPISDVKGGN